MKTLAKKLVPMIVLAVVIAILAASCDSSRVMPATGPPVLSGNGNEGSADLKQCYSRCQRSILLNYEWCAQACRCALGYERCGPLPEGMEQS